MEPEILYICEKNQNNITAPFTQSKLHCHDHPELSIILAGQAKYTFENTSALLTTGQLIIFKPNTPHSVIIPQQDSYHDLHIGVSHLAGSLSESMPLFSHGYLIINFIEQKTRLYELCKLLRLESTERKTDSKLMLQALVLQLFVLTSREIAAKSSSSNILSAGLGYPDKHKVVEFITHYINDNYMNEISLDMFAKDMYLSQVYISKVFKEETGHSPIHYLIKKRLSKAKEILETEHLPIKIVSSRVGYEDAYHFSKLFKKYYGYPPSEVKLKEQNKKGLLH